MEKYPIKIEVKIAELWYNHNDRTTQNSLVSTIKFLNEINESSYERIRVEPIINHNDDSYIVVYGWRLENEEEFKARITEVYSRNKRSKICNLQSYNWLNSELFEQEQMELLVIINSTPRDRKIKDILE